MRNILAVLFSIVVLADGVHGQWLNVQRNDDTLALIGNDPITSRDLFERVSLMPFQARSEDKDFESIKKKGVESLVGERLLALDAEAGHDSVQWQLTIVQNTLKKIFIRDAMYRKEIRDRVAISDGEITEGFRRYGVRRSLIAVRLPGPKEAQELSRDWRRRRMKGEYLYSLLASCPYRYDTLFISFGSIDTTLEESAFRLKDTLDISPPVQSSLVGAIVIGMLGEETTSEVENKTYEERIKAVERIIRERKEGVLTKRFVTNVLAGQQMVVDSALFRTVGRSLWEKVRADTSAHKIQNGWRYQPGDIFQLLQAYRTQLDTPLIRGTFGTVSLGECLQNLYYLNFIFPSLRMRHFADAFFQAIRSVAESEIIAQEGIRRGYTYDKDVRHDVQMWLNYFRSIETEYSISENISLADWEAVRSLWLYNMALIDSVCFLNVQEILRSDSLSSVEMMRLVRRGENMDSLARLFSLRTEWRGRGGRSGWFRFSDHHVLAGKLMSMSVGDMKAGIRLNEGYSTVVLLGRRFDADSSMIDSLLSIEKERVFLKHHSAAVNSLIAKRAVEHHVAIFYDRLQHADVANLDMYTQRMIGFGGKISASPVLQPNWQWIDEWKRLQAVVP